MIGKKNYKDRMVIDTKIHFGKPCVASTRIPVENVLKMYLNWFRRTYLLKRSSKSITQIWK